MQCLLGRLGFIYLCDVEGPRIYYKAMLPHATAALHKYPLITYRTLNGNFISMTLIGSRRRIREFRTIIRR